MIAKPYLLSVGSGLSKEAILWFVHSFTQKIFEKLVRAKHRCPVRTQCEIPVLGAAAILEGREELAPSLYLADCMPGTMGALVPD